MKVLVTGGLGYIGSHVVMELLARGHTPFVVDQDGHSPNKVHIAQAVNGALWLMSLEEFFNDHYFDELLYAQKRFDAVIHLAAYISVEESVKRPHTYWENNVGELLTMGLHCETDHLIFASTGTAGYPANPYAFSKLTCERYIQDVAGSDQAFFKGHTTFRFFNVSGLAPGLQPTGQPTHLIRLAAMAARGKIPQLAVYGDNWDTIDGTCVRDYIHVADIASSIVNAVEKGPINTAHEGLGTGTGSTVLEVIQSMKKVSGVDFRVTMAPRRPGDVASMRCSNQYPYISLNHDLDSICRSAYENIQ